MTALHGRSADPSHLVGVVGYPVRHSLSPTIHNAAFRALDMSWSYLAFEVPPGEGADAVRGARALGLAGLNVTMPHKEAAANAVDRLSPTAQALGSVNTVHRGGNRWVGESTDGPGFIDALRHDEGFEPAGKRCVVVGAGGAARAVILALAEAGASDIAVLNRTAERAERAVQLAGAVGRLAAGDGAGDVAEADLVVNATPVGMAGVAEGEVPLAVEHLHAGQVVADLVYHPVHTPLLVAARERGAVAVVGLGMLIHQAAHAFRLWTGEDPPLAAMSAAAIGALTSR